MLSNITTASGSPRASVAYHAPRPRNRKPNPTTKPKPYTQLPTPPSSCSSGSASPPPASRWTCMLPGCSKSYGRVYDLERHLISKHTDALCDADDVTLLSTGISPASLPSLRSKLGKRYVCEACNSGFLRSDALSRHMDEQGHRPITIVTADPLSASAVPVQLPAPPPAPPGYAWQLQPLPPSTPPAVSDSEIDWSAILLGGAAPAPTWTPPAPTMDSSPDTSMGPLPPTPNLADLLDFPPLPVQDTGASEASLFPDNALCEELLSLCADLPLPSESDVDRALKEWCPDIWG